MKKEKVSALFDWFFVILFLLLVVGIPLLFTSYTRSVFEVNKLLILRLVTIFAYVGWLLKYILFKDNGFDNAPEESVSILGFRWKKIGLEVPMLIWIGFNIASTFLSQNIRLCIIGAYDRWEGIITVLNYMMLWLMLAKLVTKRFQIKWILLGIITPAAISSVYGIFQSFGKDFMNWSVNPTARVFACINNPVHFCAYMGMVVPVALAWLFLLSRMTPGLKQLSNWRVILKWVLFVFICMIYYAQVLSFSRATWLGFIWAMPLFYLGVLRNFNEKNDKAFLADVFFTLVALGTYTVTFIFNLYEKGIAYGLGLGGVLLLYLVYSFFVLKSEEKSLAQVGWEWVLRIGVIVVFGRLQFVAVSISSIFIYAGLTILLFFALKRIDKIEQEIRFWLLNFVIVFGLVLVVPAIPTHMQKAFDSLNAKPVGGLKAAAAIEGKVNAYKDIAIHGSARTSMWKSSFPWIKDFWLLGSGPDTIKYMYPVYRRTEYGILEGGHNFTPDRLHNEYLNTFATRGIPATVVYYLGLVLGWYFLVLRKVYAFRNNPYQFVLLGFLAGATVYLGQVLFNFGVVATLVLFYIYTGLAQAVAKHPDFEAQDEKK